MRERPWYKFSTEVEEFLYSKIRTFLERRLFQRKPGVEDIFDRVTYIAPEDLETKGWVRRKPLAAFNPGAIVLNKKLLVFPRLIYGYYHYASAIGEMELDLEELLSGEVNKPLPVRLVIYPTEPWEMALGCEDPRVTMYRGHFFVLYVGVAHDPERLWIRPVVGVSEQVALQAVALLDKECRLRGKDYLKIVRDDEIHVPRSWRDSAVVTFHGREASLLVRPMVKRVNICWRGFLNLETLTMDAKLMEPILACEEWEVKVGWSTNTVKLSSNEYLIGWHGVSMEDGVYREGLAVVDEDGELIAITPEYVLAPKGPWEMHGDRPGVIFGDGLVLYDEKLIWVGGVGDHVIGIFTVDLERALESLKWIRG